MSLSSIIAYYKYIDSSIKINNNIKYNNLNNNYFKGKHLPNITIIQYIHRLFDNKLILNENKENIILHSIALLNYMKIYGVYLNDNTAHRLILISLLLISKLDDDFPQLNTCWALYGGTTLDELNIMEARALGCLKYNLFISPQNLLSIHKSIY